MVIDPGHNLDFLAAGQEHPAHHVHLPQRHGSTALPPAVILPPPAPLAPLHQVVAHQRPVDRRPPPAADQHPPAPAQTRSATAPPRMRPPDPHDRCLDHHGHLMRARTRPRGPVRQPAQPILIGIPGQLLMHRLARHPIPARHLGDRRAFFQDLQHGPVPLLHDTQLHQHTRPPHRDPA